MTGKNDEFDNIVNDIINNDKFLKLKEMSHHGLNRYDHSFSVAYYVYKLAKYLKLDYFQATRGALMHDFFESPDGSGLQVCFKSIVNHPEIALNNAKNEFSLVTKEEDIILSHMFPFGTHIPKCAESWLVNGVDKFITVCEVTYVAVYKMNYASNILKLFLINLLR